MFVYLTVDTDKHEFVVQEVESHGYTVMVDSFKTNSIIVNIPDFQDELEERERFKQEFIGIDGILKVDITNRYLKAIDTTLNDSVKSKICRMFFDVDSTLTQGKPGTLHPVIEEIFINLRIKKIHVYLVTGRSMSKLLELTQSYPVSENCIAENGGLILGFPPKNYYEFGTITNPKKILNYLQSEHGIGEDMDQPDRFTEVVLLQNEVNKDQIKEAMKKTGVKVDIHSSKDSYHLSEIGINKGTAILKLATLKHWGDDYRIAVGDADMDIPMFKKTHYSFAVGNSSENAKKTAKQVVEGKFEEGIREIYDLIHAIRP